MKPSLHFIEEDTVYIEVNTTEVCFKAGEGRGTDKLKEYRSCLHTSKTSNKGLRMSPVGCKFGERICLNTATNKRLLWAVAFLFYSVFISFVHDHQE